MNIDLRDIRGKRYTIPIEPDNTIFILKIKLGYILNLPPLKINIQYKKNYLLDVQKINLIQMKPGDFLIFYNQDHMKLPTDHHPSQFDPPQRNMTLLLDKIFNEESFEKIPMETIPNH